MHFFDYFYKLGSEFILGLECRNEGKRIEFSLKIQLSSPSSLYLSCLIKTKSLKAKLQPTTDYRYIKSN